MKKVLSVLLVLATLLSVALSLSSCLGDPLVYTPGSEGGYVADIKDTKIKKLVIPEKTSKGLRVTKIFGEAFTECKSLESVTIPKTVTEIDGYAFAGCTALTSITVDEENPVYHSDGNCVIKTETNVLVAGCKTSVIPDYVTAISTGAFGDISTLESVTLPETLVYIGLHAFRNCSSLKSINIPKSVIDIDSRAFIGCSFESITVEEGSEKYFSIDNCLMESGILIRGCKNSIIPKVAVEIADYAFAGDTAITSLNIPNNIRKIGSRVFEGCRNLKDFYYNGTHTQWTSTIEFFEEEYFEWDSAMSMDLSAKEIFPPHSYTIHFTDGDLPVTKYHGQ